MLTSRRLAMSVGVSLASYGQAAWREDLPRPVEHLLRLARGEEVLVPYVSASPRVGICRSWRGLDP